MTKHFVVSHQQVDGGQAAGLPASPLQDSNATQTVAPAVAPNSFPHDMVTDAASPASAIQGSESAPVALNMQDQRFTAQLDETEPPLQVEGQPRSPDQQLQAASPSPAATVPEQASAQAGEAAVAEDIARPESMQE